MDAASETIIKVEERSGKHIESFKNRSDHFLAVGHAIAIRYFDDQSIDDMMYLHRIMMNPEVQKRMDEMDEVVSNWNNRWTKDDKANKTYVEKDLRAWMRMDDLQNILFAIAEKPILPQKNSPRETLHEHASYRSEVFGFIFIYEKEADLELLKKLGAIPPDFTGTIYETSSGKAEDAQKGIGSEARTLALSVFKKMYQEKHAGETPVFTTDVAVDNIPSLKSVQKSGYEPVGTYKTKNEDGTESELVILKLNWAKHAQALEKIQRV